MATSTHQRVGIWIIAAVMLIGTIGSFAVIILADKNQQVDTKNQQAMQEKYQKIVAEYQAKADKQAGELSQKYFAEFNQYASRPAVFDANGITEIKKEDLKVGDGEEVTPGKGFVAYYIGWNPAGKVFDKSIDGDKLKSPFPIDQAIEGWKEGATGMKVGGVREVTLPAAKAYGEKGSGEDIPPNTPLKFVMFIIPTPEKIPEPDLSGLQ